MGKNHASQYANFGSLLFTCGYLTNKVFGKLGLFYPTIAFYYADFALLH